MFADADTVLRPDAVPLTWQGSLLGSEPAGVRDDVEIGRTALDDECWLDEARGWLAGADEVFAALQGSVAWRCPVVSMYERRLRQPRLSAWFGFGDDELPDVPVLHTMRAALSDRYEVDFDSVGFNLYRDGTDSVAWHGDRHAKVQPNPIVAIVSLGSPRPFLLRPSGGGSSRRMVPHPGDLLVMGGACQHRWQHSVPKVRTAGPRLSISFRHGPCP